jgi:type II secretory pathway component PulF
MNHNTELASYTRQLAFLTGRGISLGDAIVNTCGDIKDRRLQESFVRVVNSLEKISEKNGKSSKVAEQSIYESLNYVYPPYIMSIIRQAKTGAELSESLEKIAGNLEREEEMKRDVTETIRSPV